MCDCTDLSGCEQVVILSENKEILFINTTRMPLCVICGNITIMPARQLQIQNSIIYDVEEVEMDRYEVVLQNITTVPMLIGKKNSIVCINFKNVAFESEFYTEGKGLSYK